MEKLPPEEKTKKGADIISWDEMLTKKEEKKKEIKGTPDKPAEVISLEEVRAKKEREYWIKFLGLPPDATGEDIDQGLAKLQSGMD